MSGKVQGVAGAVVEPGDDLHLLAAGQPVVGEVRLPGLVGHGGLEAVQGGLGSLLRFRGDQPGAGEVAADRGAGDLVAVVVVQVPGNGVRAGVVAGGGQSGAQFDDELHHGGVHGIGVSVRSSRAGLERVGALGAVAGHEAADPGLGQTVAAGGLSLREALGGDGGDDQFCSRHGEASTPDAPCRGCATSCCRCPETCLAYVLNQHTVIPTTSEWPRTSRSGAFRMP